VLTNYDLYVYQDKESQKHKEIYVLGQGMGIFVKALDPIPISN